MMSGVTSPWTRLRAAVLLLSTAAMLLAGPGLAATRGRAPGPGAVRQAEPAQPAAGPVVAVFGDAYAEALTEGLQADLDGRQGMSVLQDTHAPFGLADKSRFDWTKAIGDALSGQPIETAVVMLGANDREALPDGAGTVEPLTPRWRAFYGERVTAVATLFQNARIPLIWVGLPIVGDEAVSATYVALNEITRDRAVAAGGSYVDAWNAFADESGRYNSFGPDAKGKRTRLRTEDGMDFTRAGAIKLASFVETEIRARRAATSAPSDSGDLLLANQPDFDKPLDNDVNAQIRREAGLPALPSSGVPGKAEHGPLIALTAPALAEGGRLVEPTIEPAPLIGAGGTLAQRALVEGLPIQPKAGRTDDFSWPRP